MCKVGERMNVLGLHVKHDASACVFKDNKLVAFVEEERFSRQKRHYGFPYQSVDYCLRNAGLDISEINRVAVGNLPPLKSFTNNLSKYYFNGVCLMRPLKELPKSIAYSFGQLFSRNSTSCMPTREDFFWIEHHSAHAASTYFCSPFKKSMYLTLDAWGDNASGSYGIGEESKLVEWHKINSPNSLGFIYSRFTEYLGYPYDKGHEAKVMGMAAYGNPEDQMQRFFNEGIISDDEKFGVWKTNQKYGFDKDSLERIELIFGIRNTNPKALQSHYSNVAATLQRSLEASVVKTVQEMVRTFGNENLCLAGGVALNCKMNGEILKGGAVKNIYIPPHAHDAGKAIGAALQCLAEEGKKAKINLDTAYWGPEFSNEEIEVVLKENNTKITYEKAGDIAGLTAEHIAKGEIVAWFQGRMEVGARALGNRSIVADPTSIEIKDKINVIKQREFWRPLCPSIKREAMEEYFGTDIDAPFMSFAVWCKEEKRKEIPGVVHVDNSVRPQSVTKKQNPKYYKLIEEFEKLKGVPMVLNTSFNVQEPIICTPKEAVATFLKSKDLNALAIGDYWVVRR